ncbi:translocation/assembly module TamB domain-containing protein [Marinobacter zhejiangensis]|uniref:Translocation and assembly module TamB n=1 Tax=Marinobacter zhejiangensis TaxID=488535 RepID=A0A1I4NMX3_9GAMM|nr:translocation/assembly module TamB domain-containing protein [Marinobacter zhejiangensis]SFM16700.1 translocation and assembly module TamB [Marinobacter zhejiangensis]
MRRHIHWLRFIAVVLVGMLLWMVLVLAGLLIALGSDSGTRWVLSQIPGLEVQNGQGSLFGRWQADHVRWRGYGVAVDTVTPRVAWSPSCLFTLTVCLDELSAAQTDVVIQPSSEEPSEGDFSLPSVLLPVDLDIRQVAFGPLTVNQTLIWDDARLSAKGIGSAWQIHDLQYHRDTVEIGVRGWLETRGDWPLALDVDSRLPPPRGDDWSLALALSGNARNIRVKGGSDGYLDAELEGRVEPFEQALPATLSLRARDFLALDTLPSTLMLSDWQLTVDGSLAEGFQSQTRATLAGTEGGIALSAGGLVTETGVQNLTFTLGSPEAGESAGRVTVAGDLGWQDGISANADILLAGFPWYQLVPGMAEPPVALEQLQGHARYDNGQYQADLQAQVDGPMGEAELEGRLRGDMQSLTLDELRVTTGAGEAKGRGTLQYAGPLTWDVELGLTQFNPGYWVPILQAGLDGTVTSQGSLDDDTLKVAANWAISGQWQSQDAASQGALTGVNDDWRLADFALTVGENRLSGQGRWQQQIDGQVTLDFPSPELLVPGLQGHLQGQLTAAGTLQQPQGQLALSATDVDWQGTAQAGRIQLEATLAEHLSLDARLQASGLKAGDQDLGRIDAGLTGTPERHTLVFESIVEVLATRLQFDGRWGEGWSGQLSRGEIELPQQDQLWRLDTPATLTYQQTPSLELGPHCWRWQESSVCAGQQSLMPRLALNYQLQAFPTAALAPVLPKHLRWQSELDGRFALDMTELGPDGQLELSATPGSFDLQLEDEWHAFAYDLLSVSLKLKPESATFDLALSGPELGKLTAAMTLDPSTPAYPMTGNFHLASLNLAPLAAILDLEVLEGTIGGAGTLSGPLLQPDVHGTLNLENGKILDSRLPMPMESIGVDVQLNGKVATIAGNWQSHERSSGQVRGTTAWHPALVLDLALTGQRLPFSYEPFASVELEPDLKLQYRDGGLAITGTLAVPRGQITVKELPEQAVTVSSDEVIVGKPVEEPILRSLTMDVRVDVGSDEVTFEGFGITGDLEGGLRVGNNMDARGVLQLTDGNFEAFGTELVLRRARLVFVGSLAEPYLDVEAVRFVDDVTAGLRLTGPVSGPSTEVFSEPAMSQQNALSYVILGRPLQTEGDQGQVGQAAISLGLARASKVTEKIGEELGIDQLVLETEGSGDDASVVASGYITEDLSVRYGVGIFEPVSTVALRYDLGRYFYLEAASGLAASLDLFYTRDF